MKSLCMIKRTMLGSNGDLYTVGGLASYSVKSELAALLATIQEQGLRPESLNEFRRLLRSRSLPHIKGTSPVAGYHIMTVKEGIGLYKNAIDPYVYCEILSTCIADAVFETMKYILEFVCDVKLKKSKYKWSLFNGDRKVGDLFYDRNKGATVRRLRASMTRNMIVICWMNEQLVTRARIHFGPKVRRHIMRDAVFTVLVKKQKEFEAILASRPRDLLQPLIDAL